MDIWGKADLDQDSRVGNIHIWLITIKLLRFTEVVHELKRWR